MLTAAALLSGKSTVQLHLIPTLASTPFHSVGYNLPQICAR